MKSNINWLKPAGTYQGTLFAEEMNKIWTTKNILIQLSDANFFLYKLQVTTQSFLGFNVTQFICIWLTRDLWIVSRGNPDLRPNFKCFAATRPKTLWINWERNETASTVKNNLWFIILRLITTAKILAVSCWFCYLKFCTSFLSL